MRQPSIDINIGSGSNMCL